jgi:TPR repeat protein
MSPARPIAAILSLALLLLVLSFGAVQTAFAGVNPGSEHSGSKATDFNDGTGAKAGQEDLGSFQDWTLRALKGDPVAQYRLGLLYEEEGSESADFAEAARWYRKAAQQGIADAQQRLGLLYARGKGLPGSRIQAYYWLTLAADRLEPGLHRDQTNEMRGIIAAFMSKSELARAEALIETHLAN